MKVELIMTAGPARGRVMTFDEPDCFVFGRAAVVSALPALLRQNMQSRDGKDIVSAIVEAFRRLSEQLSTKSQKIPEQRGLGSTAVMLLIRDQTAYVAYVADSRVYLV